MGPVSSRAEDASGAAFDAASSGYDAQFSAASNPLVAMLRARVWAAFARHFAPGSRLLELGCGTGEDALALAARGHRIVATDPAAGMLAATAVKLAAAGRADAVTLLGQGVSGLAERWPDLGLTVDGAYSNFAPLNCELSLAPLGRLLAQALPPGGRFVAVVLPRVAPLEVLLFLATGQPRTALRRFRRDPVADVEGHRFPIRYYGARDFDRALGPAFRRIETRSLGVVLPPPSFGRSFARVPGLLAALGAVEDRVATLPVVRGMGDHVLLAYERRSPSRP